MLEELRELWKFRELLITMVQREIRIRYKNSILGFLWSFINPLVTTLVFWVVFSVIGDNHIKNYSAYVLAAYLPFMFVQFSVLDASQSILSSISVVKKIYFPREILPIATVISNLIHLLLGFVIFFVYLAVVWAINPTLNPFQVTVVYLPLLLVVSTAMALGLAFIVSAINTFYEDVKYLVTVGMNLLFYVCPIVYMSELVYYTPKNQESGYWLYRIYNLNPMAAMCSLYREVLLAPQDITINKVQLPHHGLRWPYVVWACFWSFAILIFGYSLFNRMKWKFVERP